jgi:hypothetical protein
MAKRGFCWFEGNGIATFDFNLFTSLWGPAQPSFSIDIFKRPKSCKCDLSVLFLESRFDAIKCRFKGNFRGGFGYVSVLGNFSDQFCFGHLVSLDLG